MSPHRVVEKYPRSLEGQLLRAGQAVAAPDATLEVTLSALGLGATATVAASVSQAAHAKAWGLFGTVSVKWTAIAILAAAGAFAAARLPGWLSVSSASGIHSNPRQSPAQLTPAGLPEQPQRARAAVTAARTDSPSAATVAETLVPENAAAVPNARATPAVAPNESPRFAAKYHESLAAEVALIDAARRAIDERQGGRAFALLQQHDRQFKAPRLEQEAALLRSRALEQLQHENEAKAAAAAVAGSSPPNQLAEPQD